MNTSAIPSESRAPYRREAGSAANLPDGKTCGDCVWLERCADLVGADAGDERCDFIPIRFFQRRGAT